MTLEVRCPACRYVMDRHRAVGGDRPRQPRPGSVAMCVRCAGLAMFDTSPLGVGLILRTPTEAELEELLHDRRIVQMIIAHREVNERHRR